MSQLVVAGVVGESTDTGVRVIDGEKVNAHRLHITVDRVFKGEFHPALDFTWFSIYMPPGQGFLYSGPPLANFRSGHRYLIFLSRDNAGWRVAMPVYAIEIELAKCAPVASIMDLSQAPAELQNWEMAEELERTAMQLPPPQPGTTGEVPFYFSHVFDLIGGCAAPLYRHFAEDKSPELRKSALEWLQVIKSKGLTCSGQPVSIIHN